ncbi:MAG: hypothetical protein K2P70_02155 [Hyphomonadaceae bacterium]|nr:hypothetical protein [Hyphomonadaceae bacterium]
MSSEALSLLGKLALYVGLPVAAYLSILVARKAAEVSASGKPHRLILTERLLFVAAGIFLIGLGVASFREQPRDYSALAISVGAVLLVVPLVANVRRLKLGFGLQATLAQGLLVGTAFVAFLLISIQAQRITWPTLETLRGVSSLVTWPVIVLLAGIVFFPDISRILGSIESLEGFGGKVSFRRKEEIEEEVEEALSQDIQIEADGAAQEIHRLSRTVRTQENRYANVITAWGVLAKVITTIALPHGGANDYRRIRENVRLLSDKGVLPSDIGEEAVRLFAERNGYRRRTSSKITADEHRRFLDAAEALANRLQPFLPASPKS